MSSSPRKARARSLAMRRKSGRPVAMSRTTEADPRIVQNLNREGTPTAKVGPVFQRFIPQDSRAVNPETPQGGRRFW